MDAGPSCPDADGDGARDATCGGTDCDDSNARRYPGNVETCDAIDNDCDPATLGRDEDMDGFVAIACCNDQPVGDRLCGTDCNDTSPDIRPTAPENCNRVDDNCDGTVDEGVLLTFYRDLDSDTFGVMSMSMTGCALPAGGGWSFTAGDCNDMLPGVNPNAMEQCDAGNVDENCREGANEGCGCTGTMSVPCGEPMGAGFNMTGQCRAGTQTCSAGTLGACVNAVFPTIESCNMLDDDCDGTVDDGVDVACYVDMDDDGFSPMGSPVVRKCPDTARVAAGTCPAGFTSRVPMNASTSDCADNNDQRNPMRSDFCNMIDDNCNGMTDEGVDIACYTDADNDSYAAAGTAQRRCPSPDPARVTPFGRCDFGYTGRAPAAGTTDCADSNINISPVGVEVCNMLDDNCAGGIDEGAAAPLTCYTDADSDGYAPMGATMMTACACPPRFTTRAPTAGNIDCNDGSPAQRPGLTELCDMPMIDENCANGPNEGCNCTTGSSRLCMEAGFLGRCATGSQSCAAGMWDDTVCRSLRTAETCDGSDQDCDGVVDNGVLTTCWTDADRDGYAATGATSVQACACATGYTARNPATAAMSDCNDAAMAINPGATETCDNVDNNCASGIDEGVRASCYADTDNDGYAASGAAVNLSFCSCAPRNGNGYTTNNPATMGADCQPGDLAAYPGAVERCNYQDDNCDGNTSDQSVASSTANVSVASGCPGWNLSSNTSCLGVAFTVCSNAQYNQARGGWMPTTARMGWGPVRYNSLVSLNDGDPNGASVPPADGMAFMISSAAGPYTGTFGSGFGIPSRPGLAVVWQFSDSWVCCPMGNDRDTLTIYRVAANGTRTSLGSVTLQSPNRNNVGSGFMGNVEIEYTPAVGAGAQTIQVRIAPSGMTPASVLTNGFPITIPAPNIFSPGDTLYFGVTGGTGGATSSAIVFGSPSQTSASVAATCL